MAFVQRRAADEDNTNTVGSLESAFAAVIEPYVGEPFISQIARLAVDGNSADARQAVALQIKLKNGREDICFADGQPEKERRFQCSVFRVQDKGSEPRTPNPEHRTHDVRVNAEFAYLSRDKDGLCQASLTGGTILETPEITLRAASREYAGKVTKVDFLKRMMWIDQAWPSLAAPQQPFAFEVGTGDHWTVYTAKALSAGRGGTEIALRDGADYYLSRVKEIDPVSNIVWCALGFGSGAEGKPTSGIDKDWYATNDDHTKSWRAEFIGGNIGLARYGFKLTGDPAAMKDFGRSQSFRLWEYGVGDAVRHSTFVSLRRVAPGKFELTGDVDAEVTIAGKTFKVSVAEMQKPGGASIVTAK